MCIRDRAHERDGDGRAVEQRESRRRAVTPGRLGAPAAEPAEQVRAVVVVVARTGAAAAGRRRVGDVDAPRRVAVRPRLGGVAPPQALQPTHRHTHTHTHTRSQSIKSTSQLVVWLVGWLELNGAFITI